MPADTSILMGYRPPQIETPDVQNARAAQLMNAQQQNVLGAMQLADRNREMQMNNALNQAYKDAYTSEGGLNPNILREKLATGGFGSKLPAVEKMLSEIEASKANVLKTKAQTKQAEAGTAVSEFELNQKKINHAWESVANSPTAETYRKNIESSVTAGHITREQADQGLFQLKQAEALDAMQGGDQNFRKLRVGALEKLLTAKDQLARVEPKYEYKDVGGKLVRVQLNPNAPDFDPKLLELAKTPTISELETARHNKKTEGIQGAELKLKQEKELREKDPAFQQAMARAKAFGEAVAKGDAAAIQALPKVLDRAERSVNLIDELVGKQEVRDKSGKVIQKGTAPHAGFENAVGTTWLPGARLVPGTDAANFQARFDEIKGGAFLEAFESLKGGGAITETEGTKATSALNRMSLAQSEREFVSAARDFQDVVRKGVENARKKAAQAGAAPNVDALLDKYK